MDRKNPRRMDRMSPMQRRNFWTGLLQMAESAPEPIKLPMLLMHDTNLKDEASGPTSWSNLCLWN